MENGALLRDLEGDDGSGPDEKVGSPFLCDSNEALAVDTQKLITSLQATVDISSATSDNRFYVDSKTVLCNKLI